MATTAQIVQFLLSPLAASGITLSGGQAFFFSAGTSTPKDVWIDRNKTALAANPYTLDANGTAQIYADGIYRVVVKDSNGITRYDRDYMNFREGADYMYDMANYADLPAAIAAIGSTPATLLFATDINLTQSAVVPPNINLMSINKAAISIASGFTITLNCAVKDVDFKGAGNVAVYGSAEYISGTFANTGTVAIEGVFRGEAYQVFNGPSAVTGLKTALPEWWGAKGDGTTDSTAAVQAALDASSRVHFGVGTYIVNGAYATKDFTHITGEGYGTVLKRSGSGYIIELRGGDMAATPPETGWMKQPIVENLALDGGVLTSGSVGLSLFGVWNGTFRELQAFNLDKVIYLKGSGICDFSGFRYSRGQTLGIPNYIIYCDANADAYRNNDHHFHDNHTLAGISHIYARGKNYSNAGLIDGFFIDNNTFFAGEHAVDGSYFTWSNISDNRIFDQTKEGILLDKSGNCIIDSNEITRAGSGTSPATYYDAIRITGDPAYWNAEVDYRNGGSNQITNNNIFEPSGNAIYATYSSHISIIGNNIFNPNCTIRNISAGGSPSILVRDAIYVDYCKGGTVTANECDSNRQMPAFTSYPEVTHRFDIYLGTNTANVALSHKHGSKVWDAGVNNILNLLDERLDAVSNGDGGAANYRNEEFFPEDLTGAGWGTSGTAPTVTSNAATAPDGTATADKVTVPAALGSMVSTRIITVNAGDSYSYAIYLKADANCIVDVQLTNNSGTESDMSRWLVTGQWKRYVITHQFAAGTTSVKFLIGNISGKSPSINFYAWGGFLKAGRTHTIPYMGKQVLLSVAPNSGTWRPGDFVRNTGAGTTMGWHRATLGSNHVVGTDWIVK